MTLNPMIWRGACGGALVLSLAGCAAEDSSGTDHVDELPRLAAAEELRIGSLDDPDMGFTRIGAVVVDHDANAYVSFTTTPIPIVYDDTVVSGIIRPHAATYAERTGTEADVLETQLRQALVLPPFQPGIAALKAGQDGSLWLRTADDGAPLAHWIILNPDGSARGVVDLPRRATLHWIDGDVSWAAMPDDVDVPWLVRYRVTPME